MTSPRDDTILKELGPDACLRLLGENHLGRLAYVQNVGITPMIVPVNYLLHDGSVVFRTDEGSKLSAVRHDEPVAFEVDGLDEVRGLGWSVVVQGHAEELSNPTELEQLRPGRLLPWAPGEKSHYVRVNATSIAGRRIQRRHSWSDWWE
jgi:nitroimidazol reductase NimA-like FMN-containing flavoprotein (pyridoxamine 5'-phosphate oxidase superfamily)